MKKIRVGIIGATGYAGVELVRLLHNHPLAELTSVSSVSYAGKNISDVYGNLAEIVCQVLTTEDDVIASSDVVFSALPHGLSEVIAVKCKDKNVKLVDLGADFRLASESEYKEWYGLNYEHKDLHEGAVYCIPELHRELIIDSTTIIANPGCYPTSIALGLAPLATKGLLDTNGIVIDSKSGVTGAGAKLSDGTHYAIANENFNAYKVACHRHTPEIEQTLSGLCGKPVVVTFVPHLLPVNRGILSTIYANANVQSVAELHAIYSDYYSNDKFVRVLPLGVDACIRNVRMSNYCDIAVHYDARCNKVIITSCIDNMVKGASGQAIQNMNIMFGLDEQTGLDIIAPAF